MDRLLRRFRRVVRRPAASRMTVQPALATCLDRLLAIVREIAGITRRTAAAVAPLAAFATCLDRPLPVPRKVTGTPLTAQPTGTRGLFAIGREISGVRRPMLAHFSLSCSFIRTKTAVAVRGLLTVFSHGRIRVSGQTRLAGYALRRKQMRRGSMASAGQQSRGALHATMREVEDGVFRAEYTGEINPKNPDAREIPDYHVGTSATDVKIWVEQMAQQMGYTRVVWDRLPQGQAR